MLKKELDLHNECGKMGSLMHNEWLSNKIPGLNDIHDVCGHRKT